MLPRHLRLWRIAILLLYLLLTCTQLGLPGLHYDEAKEAGVNALELLTGAPVTAFRGATISLFGRSLPLMVQDYIGALNVYLALPLLKLTGIGVPNLRILSVLTGLATLLLLEQVILEWTTRKSQKEVRVAEDGTQRTITRHSPPATRHPQLAALLATTLLAVSPSFVFWSRQGIFVTNLTQPLTLWAIWQGLRWLRTRRTIALTQAAFATGLALYAKLLSLWILLPFWGLLFGYLLLTKWKSRDVHEHSLLTPHPSPLFPLACFLLALSPLLLFNWQTGGTFFSVGGNLTRSYYGVNNLDLLNNLLVRLQQLFQVLCGDQFSYLGGVFHDWLAPWLIVGILAVATWRNWRLMLAPLLLFLAAFAASLFTVSGLFVTHYALLQPLLFALLGVALTEWLTIKVPSAPRLLRSTLPLLLLLWFCIDLTNTVRYHQALAQSGGLGDHSDASYHLAYHLRYNGMGAPIVLDWGIEATARYLSQGTVRPIEIFGYDSLQTPDAGFQERLAPFLQNPDNVYLLRAPNQTVFAGRREAFLQAAEQLGRTAQLETTFAQRNGEVLFELWRVQGK